MVLRRSIALSETLRKRSLTQRMVVVHAVLLVFLLIIIARLGELQIIHGKEFTERANEQHYGGVVLPARRGEILSRSSKTGETSILATNTTLDLVYVDPLITDSPTQVAEMLADALVTEEFHSDCSAGKQTCPLELISYYSQAFDPMMQIKAVTGVLLEPLNGGLMPSAPPPLPDLPEVRRQFARAIESRISEKNVNFAPLMYGATKVQMQAVGDLGIVGVTVQTQSKLIYANPEQINQSQLASLSKKLADALESDPEKIRAALRSRPLRYVPVMRKLPPKLSLRIRQLKLDSMKETDAKRETMNAEAAALLEDPLRGIALIAEHWRFYPDTTIASHVVGFLNAVGEPQYGIERTFNPRLRGQEGRISTVSDPQGRQILTSDQTIIDPKDGETIVLTIDRVVQKKVEEIMETAVKEFDADSGQAIVMDPQTGRIIAMVNAPIFDSNKYGNVYDKEPIYIDSRKYPDLVVEIYHPETNEFVLRSYVNDVFTSEGREQFSEEKRLELSEIEKLHDLRDIARYYLYIGENARREIFPTDQENVWLKYKNNLGVGAYLNRTIQEIYEPGSVLKMVTMAIAVDQGEVAPSDTYEDVGTVEVDEYKIKNALNAVYGHVTMINCIEFSINTCMTTVSQKLGKKLFHRMLIRFGFGRITGIELEDELPGEIQPWRKWSNALLATSSYGQGISTTPLQVVTAFASLANGGKLMRPTIVDSIIHSDGTVEEVKPRVVDQVITRETADTMTAMLVSSVEKGFAKVAKVPGYKIAGKTGTSQIAGPGGKYEAGTGATIPTFAGYAPVDHPKFVILVKFDRARKDIYGSKTAGPVFKEIAAFLFEYYGIPPDDR